VNQPPAIPSDVQEGIDLLKKEDPSAWFDVDGWRFQLLLVLVLIVVVLWLYRKLVREIKRRRKPRLHPKLQKYGEGYGEPDPKLLAQRRAEAEKIVATSSTPSITGYELVEQVEAVFVDGFRNPQDALEGLKAAAAMKGANAVANVRQERTASGKCGASGDAVVVRRPEIAGLDTESSEANAAADPPQTP